MKKRFVSLVLACSLIVSFSAVSASTEVRASTDQESKIVYATETTGGKVDLDKLPEAEKTKLKKRFAELQSLFIEQGKARAKLAEAKKEGNDTKINKASDDVRLFDKKARDIGLVPFDEVKQNSEVSILSSSNSDFVYDYKNFSYDTKTGKYIWQAQGQFDSGNDWASECFCSPYYFTYDLGGDDGFGLASLHKDVNIYDYEFWTVKSDLVTAVDWSSNVAEINGRGVGWKWQDDVYAGFGGSKTYNSHRRFGWMVFDFVGGTPTGQSISFQSSTAHTWDKSAVSEVAIGTSGVQYTFNKSSEVWNKPTNGVYTP